MKKDQIKSAIVKFLNNEADHDDLVALDLWLRNKSNLDLFNRFVKTEHLITLSMKEFDVEKAKLAIQEKRKANIKNRRIVKWVKYAAAAVIIGLISIPFLDNSETIPEKVSGVQETIVPGSDNAILTLENGNQVALDKNKSYSANSVNSDGKTIVYDSSNEKVKETVYNYLTIPRGGQFSVKLSDGTQVWLNSDSKIKYPKAFIEGDTRVVELIYGEAYFDVSPSTNHKGASFKVLSGIQEVKVIGTEFNVKAYKDENYIYTTLVEGEVEVDNSLAVKLLKIGQQSKINVETKNIDIIEADVYREISWKDGVFSFRRKSLKEIMQVLARWYDMDIVFENKQLENERFIGTLDKSQSIENIMYSIKNTIKKNISYEINNKTIYIK